MAPAERRNRVSLGANFSKLLTAATISSTGDGVTFIAAPLLAATITRDPRQIAGIETALALPWLLFSLPAGALVDRWDRRKVLWIVDAFRCGITAVLAIATAAEVVTMPMLYLTFFLLGTGQVFFDNADQAFLPQVVASDGLERANARLQSATLGSGQLFGPAFGSLLFGVTASLPFAFDAGTFAAASLLAFTIQGSFTTHNPAAPVIRPTLRSDIAEGWRYLTRHRLLRRLAIVLGLLNLFDLIARATFVLYAQDRLHLSKLGFGVVLTMGAVGGIIGGIAADRMGSRRPKTILAIVVAVMGISHALIPTFTTAIIAGVAFAINGGMSVLWNVVTVSARQQIIPTNLFARVNSVYRLLAWGTMPIGAFLGGFIANRYGLAAPFWVASAGHGLLIIAAVAWLSTDNIDAARAESDAMAKDTMQ